MLAGKLEPVMRTDCAPVAGKSTLNRLEHVPKRNGAKYHKIDCNGDAVDALLVEPFVKAHERPPRQIVLDLDATDTRCMAIRKAASSMAITIITATCRFTCSATGTLLLAKLRCSDIDASAGTVEEIARIVAQIRAHWPRVRIMLRADFAREALMHWCETNGVDQSSSAGDRSDWRPGGGCCCTGRSG